MTQYTVNTEVFIVTVRFQGCLGKQSITIIVLKTAVEPLD